MKDENQKQETESDLYEKFMKVADVKLDEVTMILRSHLLAEYYLDHIIMSNMSRGDVLLENKFSFNQKLQIVEAFNIVSKAGIDSVKKLNSIRNNCAHNLDFKVTEAEVDQIGRSYGKKYLDIKSKYYKSVKELLHWTLVLPVAALAVHTEQK